MMETFLQNLISMYDDYMKDKNDESFLLVNVTIEKLKLVYILMLTQDEINKLEKNKFVTLQLISETTGKGGLFVLISKFLNKEIEYLPVTFIPSEIVCILDETKTLKNITNIFQYIYIHNLKDKYNNEDDESYFSYDIFKKWDNDKLFNIKRDENTDVLFKFSNTESNKTMLKVVSSFTSKNTKTLKVYIYTLLNYLSSLTEEELKDAMKGEFLYVFFSHGIKSKNFIDIFAYSYDKTLIELSRNKIFKDGMQYISNEVFSNASKASIKNIIDIHNEIDNETYYINREVFLSCFPKKVLHSNKNAKKCILELSLKSK